MCENHIDAGFFVWMVDYMHLAFELSKEQFRMSATSWKKDYASLEAFV